MRQEIENLISGACKDLFNEPAEVYLTRPDEQFGDYATNVALTLSKKVGQNPREIAQQIVEKLADSSEHIKSLEIAGPGFINMTLTDNSLLAVALEKERGKGAEQIVIETNNPNPFKPMHIGHAYNAIIADSLANLLDTTTSNLARVSYHGDVGAHVGKSMWSILEWLDGDVKKLESIKPEDRNKFMADHYKNGAEAFISSEDAKTKIDVLSKQSFTREEPVFKQVYETCFNWSFEDIAKNLEKLGNKTTQKRYLESQANDKGVETVKQNIGKIFEESDGALVFHGKDYGSFTNVFVASNGQGLYGARDLGLMQLKNSDYHAKKSYIVTAEEQKDYFKGVIAAAELSMPELKGVTVNIPTGTVKLSSGKMSSRTGEVLDIAWLFGQIEAAVEEQGSVADEILVGAIRYEFLKVKVGHDVIFDVGESVSVKGNSGPYLQYAHARARSILRKADAEAGSITDLEPGERALLRKIGEYTAIVGKSADEMLPHYICTYIYELAQTFNNFYEHSRVIGDARQQQRLRLVEMYANTLKAGLQILGIPAPESM
jgi:arginyl-tRNA synthetase